MNFRKKRNRTAMAEFTQEELNQISQWLREGELTLDQIAANCEKQFSKKAEIWNLSRLRRDLGIVEVDEENEDLQEVAADLNHYAVTGEAGVDGAGFHSATLFLIEKQAFKLALQNDGAAKVSKEDHGRFKDLFRMKLAHENAQIKNRYTTHRIDLDKQKLELAQRTQVHKEIIAEQKRLDRQNAAHSRSALRPANPQETSTPAENLIAFQSRGAVPAPSDVARASSPAGSEASRLGEPNTHAAPQPPNSTPGAQPNNTPIHNPFAHQSGNLSPSGPAQPHSSSNPSAAALPLAADTGVQGVLSTAQQNSSCQSPASNRHPVIPTDQSLQNAA